MARYSLFLGSVFGFLSVALGAFAAHGLKARLSEYSLGVFQTAVHYQFFHSLALCIVWLVFQRSALPLLNFVTCFFVVGILLFSGSLYALALTDIRALGMITPLGGLSFLIGWLLLCWIGWKLS